ncbi:putative ccch zinc finger protein [Neofusicoccum parvum]|uniref:Ccch zinc finger protein n=1 Tax=Neofusicoccum parvum TaxID=310453 RepID=A0ACB5S5V1_9PEZI|nr:putative ccch zinc finger protein [Neofusicoccum parvum]
MSDQLSSRSDCQVDSAATDLWRRYHELQSVEKQKNALIEELLYRYDSLSEHFKKEVEDHDREREYNRIAQRSLKDMEATILNLKDNMVRTNTDSACPTSAQAYTDQDRDAFVLVLIDGDGLIFNDHLLCEGASGGQRAAGTLEEGVYNYVRTQIREIPPNVKVTARVYANAKGLAETCVRAGITTKAADMQDFMVGFTGAKFLMDFVDVGSGKDRADEKIVEHLKLNLYSPHCRHIMLGCSHDNGYARILGEISNYDYLVQKITLLEGVPFGREFASLPFKIQKFDGLFRPQKINNFGLDGLPAPFPPPGLAALTNKPIGNGIRMQSPKVSTTSPVIAPSATAGATPGWANVAAKAATLPSPKQNFRDPNNIPRNRKGQRIDPPTKNFDKEEVNRVKRIKMCNVHFLRHECPFGNNCTHVHDYKPNKSELETLKLVARMAPCIHGSGCDDPKCIYGHRCPFPLLGGKKSGKNCIFLEDCKFPLEMHSMDMNVVQYTTIR